MATGFTRWAADEILYDWINSETWVCLSTTTPDENGDNFTEPLANTGYERQKFGGVLTHIPGQIANGSIIFLFEAIADCGSITHVGLAKSDDPRTQNGKPFLVAQLSSPLTVGVGYVPLIRATQFIIGLDKDTLAAYA